jgi:hypothetical protein
MKTYAFITKDSWRVEVKASKPEAAYNKLLDIPYLRDMITTSYYEYDKDGLCSVYNVKSVKEAK